MIPLHPATLYRESNFLRDFAASIVPFIFERCWLTGSAPRTTIWHAVRHRIRENQVR